jgi:PAS domain S-box-containing protein
VNSRGRIIRANAAAASLFGFEEHEINGMSVRALFPGRPPIFPGGRSGQGGQAGHYLELVGRRRDSSQFPAVVSVMPVRIGNVLIAISYATVRTHVRSILAKLGARSQLEAVTKARKWGFRG